MLKLFIFSVFCVLIGCRSKESLGTMFAKNGIRGIEFFDSPRTSELPFVSVTDCSGTPCEYDLVVIIVTPGSESAKVDSLYPTFSRSGSVSLSNKKLNNFATDAKAIPLKKNFMVSISIDSAGHGRDILGLVMPLLEKLSLRPDTVEVVSLPRDSLRTPVNKSWRLISDSVELRHIARSRFVRFVRK